MASSESNVLRFAVGSPEQPGSLVWRLVVNGRDAYIGGSAFLMGTFKLSMHANEWLAGFTRQSQVVIKEKGTRHSDRWPRPAEFRPGWTRGPVIAVPWMAGEMGQRGLLFESRPGRRITWVRRPSPGEVLAFVTMLVDGSVPVDAVRAEMTPDDVLVGGVLKKDNERVFVFAHWQPIEEPFYMGCVGLLRTNRFTANGPYDPETGGSLLWVSTQGGLPCITDLPAPIDFAG